MQKKIPTFCYFNVSFVCLFLFCLVECSKPNTQSLSHWIASLVLLETDQTKESNVGAEEIPDEGRTSLYQIHSFTPDILIENTSFVMTGKNLDALSKSDVFGESATKLVTFFETSEEQITGYLRFCPAKKIEVELVTPNVGRKIHYIPCLGSFRYSPSSYLLEQNQPVSLFGPLESHPYLQTLRSLGTISFSINPILPSGLVFDESTGIVSGIPTVTTKNEFLVFTVTAELDQKPFVKITSPLKLMVLTPEEKTNRTCRAISATSTCNVPSPYTCSNSSQCFTNQMACFTDPQCGF